MKSLSQKLLIALVGLAALFATLKITTTEAEAYNLTNNQYYTNYYYWEYYYGLYLQTGWQGYYDGYALPYFIAYLAIDSADTLGWPSSSDYYYYGTSSETFDYYMYLAGYYWEFY